MSEVRTIRLESQLPASYVDTLAGALLDDTSYDTVIQESADVYKPDGTVLLKLRKGAIPRAACANAYRSLRDAATPTDNRGLAAGKRPEKHDGSRQWVPSSDGEQAARFVPIKRDGTLSKNTYAAFVNSGIVGFFDRSARHPYCRTTAYALDHPERFKSAIPFIQTCADVFSRELPERYAAQRAVVDETHRAWVIPGSVFTTLTVNKNWQTAVHQDVGDLRSGFGVMSAFTAGKMAGCYLVFPAFRVAVEMRTTDVLLADVHEWHGNSPFHGYGVYERISVVLYYREKMRDCGSPADERKHAATLAGLRRAEREALYAGLGSEATVKVQP